MPSAQIEGKGFFASLFDFGFTSYITLKFLRIIYTVMVVLILIAGLGFFFTIAARGGGYILLAIILVPIVTLFYLVLTRISLEAVALFFRIGENTSLMANVLAGGGRPGDSYGSGPSGPYLGPGGAGSMPPPPEGPRTLG